MPTYGNGRHEHGQNFLVHRPTIDRIVELVARTAGPIIEIGPGSGALTLPLESLNRPLTGVEIDAGQVSDLRRRVLRGTRLITGDFLQYRLPDTPHVIVGSLPFHQTTAILRRLLHARNWATAILLLQWEVARRRVGIGGATMMTAQWWPWYEFVLAGRVPATAFRPRPGVDGGLMTISRRGSPLIDLSDRKRYAAFVHAAFTGRGCGIRQVLRRLPGARPDHVALGRLGIDPRQLPRDLSAEQWAGLFRAAGRS